MFQEKNEKEITNEKDAKKYEQSNYSDSFDGSERRSQFSINETESGKILKNKSNDTSKPIIEKNNK